MMILSLLCVFSLYFLPGESIRCYDCNSANNSMCLEPSLYSPKLRQLYLKPVECSRSSYAVTGGEEFFCRKIVQTLLDKGRQMELRVTRGCGWVRHHKDCYKADSDDHLETVCQCFGDACNAAISVHTTGFTITILSILPLLFRQ